MHMGWHSLVHRETGILDRDLLVTITDTNAHLHTYLLNQGHTHSSPNPRSHQSLGEGCTILLSNPQGYDRSCSTQEGP